LRGGLVLDSRDLRSGMSLIAAGLAANGETGVTPLETVERGYGQLVERLRGLGAKVTRIE
jgi:UDP-N-acetylglucosamine 1-carboxyvinyltransferase